MLLILFLFIIYPALCSQYGASAFASPSIPPPPPLSVPVWSLAGFEWVSCDGGNNDEDLDESVCSSEGDADSQYGDTVRLQVLPGCASYIKLKVLSVHNAGDHDVALCEVLGTAMWNDDTKKVVTRSSDDREGKPTVPALDPSTALYTGQLREEGII